MVALRRGRSSASSGEWTARPSPAPASRSAPSAARAGSASAVGARSKRSRPGARSAKPIGARSWPNSLAVSPRPRRRGSREPRAPSDEGLAEHVERDQAQENREGALQGELRQAVGEPGAQRGGERGERGEHDEARNADEAERERRQPFPAPAGDCVAQRPRQGDGRAEPRGGGDGAVDRLAAERHHRDAEGAPANAHERGKEAYA